MTTVALTISLSETIDPPRGARPYANLVYRFIGVDREIMEAIQRFMENRPATRDYNSDYKFDLDEATMSFETFLGRPMIASNMEIARACIVEALASLGLELNDRASERPCSHGDRHELAPPLQLHHPDDCVQPTAAS